MNIGVGDNGNDNSLWSVRKWLSGKAKSAAIIGYLPSAKALSRAYTSSVIEQVTRQILDLPDGSPDARRIWLFLDEVPQAGKIPSVTELLEAARSKGVRIVLGMQSVAQVEELYSKNTLRIWAGQCSIKVIAALTEPADQKWAADLVGEREVDRFVGSQNIATGGQGSSQGGSFQRVKEHVLMPAEFGQVLQVIEEKGPRALLLAPGAGAILDWPFPPVRAQRPDRVPAAWTLPGAERPVWGAVPPQVAEPAGGGAEADTAGTARRQSAQEQQQQIATFEKDNDQKKPEAGPEVPGAADAMLDAMLEHLVPGFSLIKDVLEQMQPGAALPLPAVAPARAAADLGDEEREAE
ncbi:type IV secretion system DNA-binding domain-containing protein [Acidithiobacillus ferridurans]|nr:type IV secretion system DNA-binding domain-containing protein [Acidithiobacillus ferridurans]